jgi:hypothetical protein
MAPEHQIDSRLLLGIHSDKGIAYLEGSENHMDDAIEIYTGDKLFLLEAGNITPKQSKAMSKMEAQGIDPIISHFIGINEFPPFLAKLAGKIGERILPAIRTSMLGSFKFERREIGIISSIWNASKDEDGKPTVRIIREDSNYQSRGEAYFFRSSHKDLFNSLAEGDVDQALRVFQETAYSLADHLQFRDSKVAEQYLQNLHSDTEAGIMTFGFAHMGIAKELRQRGHNIKTHFLTDAAEDGKTYFEPVLSAALKIRFGGELTSEEWLNAMTGQTIFKTIEAQFNIIGYELSEKQTNEILKRLHRMVRNLPGEEWIREYFASGYIDLKSLHSYDEKLIYAVAQQVMSHKRGSNEDFLRFE